MYIIGQLDHLASLALRAVAKEAEFLIIAVILVIVAPCLRYISLDDIFLFIVKMNCHINKSFPAAGIYQRQLSFPSA